MYSYFGVCTVHTAKRNLIKYKCTATHHSSPLSPWEISSTFSRKTVNAIWQRKWVIPSYVQCYGHRNWSSVERRLPYSRCWSYDSIVGHFGRLSTRRRRNIQSNLLPSSLQWHTHEPFDSEFRDVIRRAKRTSFVSWQWPGDGTITFRIPQKWKRNCLSVTDDCLNIVRLNNWANAMETITKLTHNEHLHFIEFNVKVLVE